MRIGWVGGLLRARVELEETAAAAGHELEVHSGDVRGRGAQELSKVVDRCDVVVIVIEVNSHGGALQAKHLARLRGRPAVVVRRSSSSTLRRVIASLEATAA
ncbi:MAG: DUF2325 domain-containing protein [Polyangiaceae bacterium]|jgi:DNA-binding LytR/AlgR family response regulator|nr:DUF2325 domain-containing protein [Polyangiaceae bacterium]